MSILLAFAVKLVISFTTIGTNDAAHWYTFQSYVSGYGGISLYHHIGVFNHPPFMIHVLRIMGALTSSTGISFYFWLRLPAILRQEPDQRSVGSTQPVNAALWRTGGWTADGGR